MIKRFLLLAILFSVIAAPASAQLLYKVSGNLTHDSYILGTHHLAPVAILDSIPGFRSAWESVESVAGEVDMTVSPEEMGALITPYMFAPQDSTISRLVDAETYQTMNRSLKGLMGGIPADLSMFDNMRPMVLANIVTVNLIGSIVPGYNPQEQLDTYLQRSAAEEGKRIEALETLDMQARLLYSTLPLGEQIEALQEVLYNPESVVDEGKKLNALYFKGDLDEMLRYGEEIDEHPEFMKHLLDRRNSDWLTKLPAMLEQGPVLVAVGALHLPGGNGILAGLRKAGYKVESVKK